MLILKRVVPAGTGWHLFCSGMMRLVDLCARCAALATPIARQNPAQQRPSQISPNHRPERAENLRPQTGLRPIALAVPI